MKKFFVEFNSMNAVVFADGSRALVIDESDMDFGEALTIEVARNSFPEGIVADTADEAKCEIGFGTLIYWQETAEELGADKVTEI